MWITNNLINNDKLYQVLYKQTWIKKIIKGIFPFNLGASPQTPGVYRVVDQSMRSLKEKGRTFKYGPHTSVILPALGSLPSVALSSGRISIKYINKLVLQVFFNEYNRLESMKNGNYNCR